MSPNKPPRIAIAGMAIESSVYAEHRAGYRDFHVLHGQPLIERYAFLAESAPLRGRAEYLPVFYARSIPGGQVQPEVYQDFKARIVAGLRDASQDGPVDGVFLDLHGAMSVEGMQDAEGDLLLAVRGVVGPEPLISAAMDLHGNLSERFVRGIDLATCYRTAPHEDVWETRERAVVNLLDWLDRGTRPRRAWVAVPILLPGEKTSTRVEPASSLYRRVPEIETLDGITDAAIWIGYAWADEPRCHASILVSGHDAEAIRNSAEDLARGLWDVRDQFDFVGPAASLDQGVDAALQHLASSDTKPYIISDSGDNPGAGGSGDVTYALTRLLHRKDLTSDGAPRTYVASVFDARAIEELFALEVGQDVDVVAGARIDSRVSPPVRLRGTLLHKLTGDPDAGRIAVIRRGGLHVIVTEFRKAYHRTQDFADLGLDPAEADIIVTKIGYLEPTLYEIAAGWTLALTPGPVDQDLERLGHHEIRRPMFPFDQFEGEPALKARLY